jgi:hypothetical protein
MGSDFSQISENSVESRASLACQLGTFGLFELGLDRRLAEIDCTRNGAQGRGIVTGA